MSSETKDKIVMNIYENSLSTGTNNQIDNEECYADVDTIRALPTLPLNVDEEGGTAVAGLSIWRKENRKWLILALAVGLVLMLLLWLILIILVFTYYSVIAMKMREVMRSNNETIQKVFEVHHNSQENRTAEIQAFNNIVSHFLQNIQTQHKTLISEIQTVSNGIVSQVLQAWENLDTEIKKQSNTISKILQAQESLQAEIQKLSNNDRGDISCPSSWKCIGKHGYFLSTALLSWEEAKTDCIRRQSQLLVLTNKAEMDALVTHMNGNPHWIGLKRNTNTWTWLNGIIPSFTSWSQNEPNNAGGIEDCVELKSGLWNDVPCTSKLAFICKSILTY